MEHTTFNTTLNGSKAKFAEEVSRIDDILEVSVDKSDTFLAEIESPKRQPKLRSVIVCPVEVPVEKKPRGLASHNLQANQQQRDSKVNKRVHTADSPHRPRGAAAVKRARTVDSIDSKVVWSNRPRAVHRSNSPKSFETRATQTDRVGPCKCARQLQLRNEKRRQRDKQSNQIVQILERSNVLRFLQKET